MLVVQEVLEEGREICHQVLLGLLPLSSSLAGWEGALHENYCRDERVRGGEEGRDGYYVCDERSESHED